MYKGTIETGALISYRLAGWRKPRQYQITSVEKGVLMGTPTPEDVEALVKEFPAVANLAVRGIISQKIHIERSGIIQVLSTTPREHE